ncbi:formamidopyrimidine-DNA glycosylase isoform X1 [Morus notabilis]|uniref:formamidopyrimidine-DNA glycosylase isoform X1 n=1 Tax=Morus notabilis TaxID=981085 RepID=UPI000CED7B21|nr:formamidopyrimidine-DNA glycosylase isoform X1 [Morus notabilis]
MPELPEVEAARRAIAENCLGKRIKKSIVASDPKVIDGVSASDFEASLLRKTIVAAHRKGKNLWLQLDSPPFPSFQFGMAGAVYIKGVAVTKYKRSAVKDDEEWPSKYSKVFIELDDGMELSFTDKRRFAKVRLLKDPTSVPPISELGPDALLEPMTVDEFAASLSKKKIAIKALLLDQSYISGIGNWIADEVLYQAKVHPLQVAATLSKESCATLQKCIKEVIEKAVEVGADSSQYPNNWIFHAREKKPGKAFVDGKKIEFITAGGRTTAFVPELQKLSGSQAAKAVSKQGKQSNRRKGRQDEGDKDEQEIDEGDIAEKTTRKKEMKPKGPAKKKIPAKRKSKESDGGTDESEPDEDNIAGNTKPKKGVKAKGQVKKKLPTKRKSINVDEENGGGTDEEDEDAENTKPKKGPKAKGQVKKVPAKRKSKESDEEENSDGTDEEDNIAENTKPKKGTKAKGQVKKNLPAKRKSEESEGEENDDGMEDNDDEDDKVQKKRSKKVTDIHSKTGKTTKKKVQPSQTSKNVKTKSK